MGAGGGRDIAIYDSSTIVVEPLIMKVHHPVYEFLWKLLFERTPKGSQLGKIMDFDLYHFIWFKTTFWRIFNFHREERQASFSENRANLI